MHKTALILTALFVAVSAGAASLERLAPLPLDAAWGAVPAWLLAEAPEAGEVPAGEMGASRAEEADSGASKENIPIVQEIIAGVLTGSLAAVLMLKLLYGRRRKDGSH